MKKRLSLLLAMCTAFTLFSCASKENYTFSNVEWSDDYSTAKVVFVSNLDSAKKQEHSVIVISEVTKPASCTEEGVKTYKATYDGKEYTKEVKIDKLAHTYSDTVVAPTFEAEGYTRHTCSECGYHYDDTVTSMLEHNYKDAWTTTKEKHYHECLDEGYETLKELEGAHTFTLSNVAGENGVAYVRYTCSVCGYHYDVKYLDNYTYELNEDGNSYKLTGVVDKTLTEAIVPEIYNGKPVTVIARRAFNASAVKSLSLPSTIKEFESNSFYYDVTLDKVYYNGTLLDWLDINVEDTPVKKDTKFFMLDENGEEVYENEKYSELETLIIPEGVTEINRRAFYNFTKLKEIYLPKSVKSIKDQAFSRNDNKNDYYLYFEKLYYGGTLEDWCDISFETYHSVIDSHGFYLLDENGDTEFNNVKYSKVTKLVIPSTVTTIGKAQFYRVYGFDTIVVPEGVERIEDYGLNNHPFNLVLPASLKAAGDYSIRMQTYSTSIYYNGTMADYALISRGSSAFPSVNHFYLKEESGNTTYEGVKYKELTEVVIGEGVEEILAYQYYGMKCIKTVIIPSHVKKIGDYAFDGCAGIETLVLNEGLEEIGHCAFYGLNMLRGELIIPNSVKEIGDKAFRGAGSSVGFYPVSGKANDLIIVVGSGIEEITEYAFQSTYYTKSMVLSEGVKVIGQSALYALGKNVTDCYIVLPTTLTTIGSNAFYDSKVTKVFYAGTKEQWDLVEIVYDDMRDTGNKEFLEKLPELLYFYSETEPTGEGQYWHYVDGVPTVWE